MRFLVAHPGPNFSVQDVHIGWCEALRELGHQVVEYNTDDRLTFYASALLEVSPGQFQRAMDLRTATEHAAGGLYGALYQTAPDVLLVVSALFMPTRILDIARRRGTRVVVLHTESPYEDDRQVEVAQHADLNLLNDPTNLGRFPAGTKYIPHAYRPSVHHPGPPVPELECDFAFVGTGYESRIEFLERMDLAGLDVILAGNWAQLGDESPLRTYVAHALDDCLDNTAAADLYRSARVGINLYRRESQRPELAEGWAMGPREVELAACGGFFLRDPRPEGDELLSWLPTFTSPGEASELLRWWLDRPVERELLARKSMEAVADRTFTHNAAALLRLLDKE